MNTDTITSNVTAGSRGPVIHSTPPAQVAAPAAAQKTRLEMLSEFQDQVIAWNGIMTFLSDPNQTEYILQGGGGCGKTFITAALVEGCLSTGWRVSITATTHKATKVIDDMAKELGKEACTIHSLCSLRLEDDEDTGDQVLRASTLYAAVPGADGSLASSYLIIIDECSMIPRNLLRHIRNYAKAKNAKVLFVGDMYQLPPVGEVVSEVFSTVHSISTLTTPHRQEYDNPIIPLGNAFRAAFHGGPMPMIHSHPSGRIVRTEVMEDFDESFLRAVVAGDDCVMLAWTNDRVQDINRRARNLVLGEDDLPPQQWETMVANTTIVRSEWDAESRGYETRTLIKNNSLVEVQSAEPGSLFGVAGFSMTVQVIIDEESTSAEDINVFMPGNWRDAKKMKKRVWAIANNLKKEKETECLTNGGSPKYQELYNQTKAAWRDFFRVRDTLVDLRYTYACTVHKSQGSGWDYVWFDQGDLAGNNKRLERIQLSYVAVTRAKKNLFVIGYMPG